MSNEEIFIAGALAAWRSNLERADKVFTSLSIAGLEQQVAPGRNRLIYLWGHLSAMHDRMLEILAIAERVHPEFDAVFLTAPDRATELPTVEVIHAWWVDVSSKLNEGIAKFSTSDWLAKHTAVSDADFAKEPLRNKFSILLTRTNHLSYHIGQTSLANR